MSTINPDRNVGEGQYKGDTTFCPVNAYGACTYCDQCNVCHMPDPFECDDWCMFWDDWDEWLRVDWITSDDRNSFAEEEIQWARDNMGYPG